MNFVYLVFLALAWVGIECYIGGTRLLFSLPAYGLISIAAILSIVSIRRKAVPPNGYCVVATLLLGAWVLLRSWRSPVEYLALPDMFMMTACLMTYLLTAFYLTGMGERTALIAVLWAVAAVEVWVGMLQFLKDPEFMLFGLLRPPVPRASGMYISPNNFAGFLVTVAILSASLAIWSRWRVWAKFLSFYIALICLIGVAMSGSRGGYFATIGSLLSFAIGSMYAIRVADPRKFLPVAIVSLGSAAAVVVISAFLMFHSQFLTHRMQTMVTRDSRLYNWAAAIDHIHVSPWVGTGSGTHLIYGRRFRRSEIQADPVHAHCDYLELLAEYGIVGGVCMALFLIAHTWTALRSYSEILRRRLIPSGLHRSNAFAMQLGALCAVAGLAIHSLVDFDMHIPGNALIFAFLFGVLANPGTERPLGFAARRITPLAKVLLPALGCFMFWRGIPLLPSEYCSQLSRQALGKNAFIDAISYAEKGAGTAPAPAAASPGQPQPPLLDRLLAKFGPNPNNPDLYFYEGEANRALGDRMVNHFMSAHYYQKAAAAFEAGLRVFPLDESMMVRYAQVLDKLSRFDDAEVVYQKALSWDPNLGVLRKYYLDHLHAQGKDDEVKALQQKWPPIKPPVEDMGTQGDSRLQ